MQVTGDFTDWKRKEMFDASSANINLKKLAASLTERVKELNCLYGISHLFENGNLSEDEILKGVLEFVPPAWQFPEITCARIIFKDRIFQTPDFKETVWMQRQAIHSEGQIVGRIEVFYMEERPESDEGPFLKEERRLLNVIAERLANALERTKAVDTVKKSYQREKELREQLQAEMRVRVDFTRKLIHELKTPLTALIATSQLLMDETRGEKLGKLAGYILESAVNLNTRIDELHDIVRGEIGILKIKPETIQIEQLLLSIKEEVLAMAEQSGLKIGLEVEEELPAVCADSDRIRQVLLNLVNNSFKYARDGKKVIIRAKQVDEGVQVEVKDFGPGIPPERLGSLFKPGYQLTPAEEGAGGLGIGLALCKAIIELHNSVIRVESHMGHGSRFYFILPRAVGRIS